MTKTPYLAFYYRYYCAYVDEYPTLEEAVEAMHASSNRGDLSFKYIMHGGEKVGLAVNELWRILDIQDDARYEAQEKATKAKTGPTYIWSIKQEGESWLLGSYKCDTEADLETAIRKDERLKTLYGDSLVTKVTD